MVWYAYELVAVIQGALTCLQVSRTIVKSHICDVMVALQLFQHVVSADLAALINRMEQFGFEPEDSQIEVPGLSVGVFSSEVVTKSSGQTRDAKVLTPGSIPHQKTGVARFRNSRVPTIVLRDSRLPLDVAGRAPEQHQL